MGDCLRVCEKRALTFYDNVKAQERAFAEGSHNTYLNPAEGAVGVLMNDT